MKNPLKMLSLTFLTLALASFSPLSGQTGVTEPTPVTDSRDILVLLVQDADSPFDQTVFVLPPTTDLILDQLDGEYGATVYTENQAKIYEGRFSLRAEPPYENGDIQLEIEDGKVRVYTSRAAATAAGLL